MKFVNNRSFSIKKSGIKKDWFVIDAKNVILGRLSAAVSRLLRGKHKANYTPHMDCGDKIIIVNAKYVSLSGKKLQKEGKIYYKHTGYPGGIKSTSARDIQNSKYPERIIKFAVKNMLPSNSLSRTQLKKNLFLYPEWEHPHDAQSPLKYDFGTMNKKNINV